MTSNPFPPAHPADGLRVTVAETGDVGVHVELFAGGVRVLLPRGDGTISHVESPTPEETGAARRLGLVLSAVARYVNTGGRWFELVRSLADFKYFAGEGHADLGDYYLLDSYLTEESLYQHVFVARNNPSDGYLWEECLPARTGTPEGGFVEAVDPADLSGGLEDEWGAEEEGNARLEEIGPEARVQGLPGGQGPGTA